MTNKNKQRKSRFLLGAGVGALLVVMALYWRCSGRGGFGVTNSERSVSVPSSTAAKSKPKQAEPPCELRLDSQGLKLDGNPIELDLALTICKKRGKAHLFITGGANYGKLQGLRAALQTAGVHLIEKAKRPGTGSPSGAPRNK